MCSPLGPCEAVAAYGTVATAVFTMLLGIGVVVAVLQLRAQREAARIVQTLDLVKGWTSDELPRGRALLDVAGDPLQNRARIAALYFRTKGQKRKRRSILGALHRRICSFVHLSARAAERIEVYVRRGAADEGIIAEHLGYGVVMTYYSLQDVMRDLVKGEGRDYEGWRLLALRCQAYARLHARETNMTAALMSATLGPPICPTD